MTRQCPPCTGRCQNARNCPAIKPKDIPTAWLIAGVIAALAAVILGGVGGGWL